MKKIVLVVDNVIIAMVIKKNLESNGYLVPFITNTFKEMLDADYEMDLVIIDMDFISLDQIEEVQIPIIFLTSQSECETISCINPSQKKNYWRKLTISCKLKLIIHRRTEYYG